MEFCRILWNFVEFCRILSLAVVADGMDRGWFNCTVNTSGERWKAALAHLRRRQSKSRLDLHEHSVV